MIDLLKSRNEIDKIDKEIVELFEKRMDIAKNVAEYKVMTGKKVLDREREEEKLIKLKELAKNENNEHLIQELFTQIMSMSRKLQYSIVPDEDNEELFTQKESLEISEDTKVVFFGIRGTYTEQAMLEYFGKGIQSMNRQSFKEVMQMVNDGEADYGVLPIENSSTGGITDIYDLLVDYDNYIVGEHVVKIDNVLMGLPGTRIEDIKKVYSHPQPLMQCAEFLENHKHMEPIEYLSTAAGAKKVLMDNDKTQAAIAGKQAAEYYGLSILKEGINFNESNSTRFIIITNKRIFLKDANKVGICFALANESGTLYNILSHFAFNHLSMSMIESRPFVGRSWEYRFFVDIEGNLNSPGVKNAINGIRTESSHFKVLGNF